MRKDLLKKFKKLFEEQRRNALFSNKVIHEDFGVNPDDRPDEVDQAATDIEQSMRMRLCNREVLFIKKIDEALKRIEDGVFGDCDECDDSIGEQRLRARPTATLCVACKEEQERREGLTAVGRLHKSLGETLSSKYA